MNTSIPSLEEPLSRPHQGLFSGFLGNISMAWKMALIVFILVLGILSIMLVSWFSLQTMRFHVSNLYDFMLIPISAIKDADIALTDIQSEIHILQDGLTTAGRLQSIDKIQKDEAIAEAVITRYDTEWVTTTSPEFTDVLRNAERLDLQTAEAATLKAYHTSFDEYKVARDAYLATTAKQPDIEMQKELLAKLLLVRGNLEKLIDINIEFADISDKAAQAALDQALATMGIVLILALFFCFIVSSLIVVSITTRLRDLTRSALAMQQGNLNQLVMVSGRDEISLLGSTFNSMSAQLKNLFDTLEEARDTAEAATQAKSLFLANMSHELRTPLSVIISHSEMLQENAQELGYEQLIPKLEQIRSSGNHLLAIISNLLDFSKIEADKMEYYLETFNVPTLVNEVAAMLQPIFEKKADTLEVDCPHDLGSMHADLTKVRQALFNILDNAAKFTEHGTVRLRATREITPEGSWINFKIEDTGIGMTPAQIQNLFKEFTQADASITREYGGTGLGLALSRNYCRMMGGDITVDSLGLGKGSTFTIRLPVVVNQISASPAAFNNHQA
jgi:signal transduction histidine kinase